MSLIVETGAGVAGAESYVSIAEATEYHLVRGNTPWSTLTDSQKEEACRRATDFMLQAFRRRWKGFRFNSVQALDWPRANVELDDGPYGYIVPEDVVPKEVKDVCSELAYRAAAGELAPDLERAVASETVGPLTVTYERGSPEYVRYRSIEMSLSVYFNSGPSTVKILRS